MSTHPPVVNAWEQLSLIPGEVYEITLRVGIVVSEEHCQLQMDWVDPSSGDLIGMLSHPHIPFHRVADSLDLYVERLRRLVHDLTGPF